MPKYHVYSFISILLLLLVNFSRRDGRMWQVNQTVIRDVFLNTLISFSPIFFKRSRKNIPICKVRKLVNIIIILVMKKKRMSSSPDFLNSSSIFSHAIRLYFLPENDIIHYSSLFIYSLTEVRAAMIQLAFA